MMIMVITIIIMVIIIIMIEHKYRKASSLSTPCAQGYNVDDNGDSNDGDSRVHLTISM